MAIYFDEFSNLIGSVDFSYNIIQTGLPTIVTFTDISTIIGDSWLWNFGDSSTSIVQNPSHSYLSPGSYTVSLFVTSGSEIFSEIKINLIIVLAGNVSVWRCRSMGK